MRKYLNSTFDPFIPLAAEGSRWSLRTRHWRYVTHPDGTEELYDHRADPQEWNNLAGEASAAENLAELRRLMIQARGW